MGIHNTHLHFHHVGLEPKGEHISDDMVHAKLKTLAPKLLLVRARLSLLTRLIVLWPKYVWALLVAAMPAKRSWLKAIVADLTFVAENSALFDTLREAPLGVWIEGHA